MKRLEDLQHDRTAVEAFLDALAGETRASFCFQTYDDDQARERARQEAIRRGEKLPTKVNPRTATLNGSFGECWSKIQTLNLNGAGVFVNVCATNGLGRSFDDIYGIPGALRAVWCSPDTHGLREDWPLQPNIVVERSDAVRLLLADRRSDAGVEAARRGHAPDRPGSYVSDTKYSVHDRSPLHRPMRSGPAGGRGSPLPRPPCQKRWPAPVTAQRAAEPLPSAR